MGTDGSAKGHAGGGADGHGHAGDQSALASARCAIAPVTHGLRTATRHNRKHAAGTILALVVLATGNGARRCGCPGLARTSEPSAGCPPASGRAASSGRATPTAHSGRLRALRLRGDIPKGTAVALDMTVQCAVEGMWITIDAVRAMLGYLVETAFPTVCGHVLAVCTRPGARPALPVEHEFLPTGMLAWPGRRKARRHVPCSNYPRVATTLCEFAAHRRSRVSAMRIPNGRGRAAPYVMITRKRKMLEADG